MTSHYTKMSSVTNLSNVSKQYIHFCSNFSSVKDVGDILKHFTAFSFCSRACNEKRKKERRNFLVTPDKDLTRTFKVRPFTLAIFAAIFAAISSAISSRPCKLLAIQIAVKSPVVYTGEIAVKSPRNHSKNRRKNRQCKRAFRVPRRQH